MQHFLKYKNKKYHYSKSGSYCEKNTKKRHLCKPKLQFLLRFTTCREDLSDFQCKFTEFPGILKIYQSFIKTVGP